MAKGFVSKLSTPAVIKSQEHYYGKAREVSEPTEDLLRAREIDFISARDSFYMSTVSEDGWPYVQQRGGPKGFLKVLSNNQLAFADFTGNRQLLTVGNVSANNRSCIFLMDYVNQSRLKILANVDVLDARNHPDLVQDLAEPIDQPTVERIFKLAVVSYDWNCPKYITRRFDEDQIFELVNPLKERITELEAKLQNEK